MVPVNYVRPERLWLNQVPDLGEQWVQDRIEEDPSILGLGDLVVRESQRVQPTGGRLDLLLQEADGTHRYEVEIQLGATDESHVIRTVEYWDVERKRYPQYEHTAVIVAENITSRFLNVISLFNGNIPLIAIQIQAMKVGDATTLIFTTVLDELNLGLVDEDEIEPPADRDYWEARASKQTVAMADQLLGLAQQFSPDLKLKYNKFYIGIAENGTSNLFIDFRPRKSSLNFEVRLPQAEEIESLISDAGLETLSYDRRWGKHRIRLVPGDETKHADLLGDLVGRAYKAKS
jgi:hypothetical protein